MISLEERAEKLREISITYQGIINWDVYDLAEYVEQEIKKIHSEYIDVSEDLWSLICNVNGGDLTTQSKVWLNAFERIRRKYFDTVKKSEGK